MPKSDSRRAALKLVQPLGECDNSQSDTDFEAMTAQQQRKIVMFADVSDSKRLFERLGDTEAAYAVERCIKRMERSIVGYGGHAAEISGHRLLAVFDSPEKACNAAVDMQSRVSKLPPVSGLKLAIRIGLHVGEISEGEGTITGAAVESAGKIAGKARIDQILASSLLIAELPRHTTVLTRPLPDLGNIEEGDSSFPLAGVEWVGHDDLHRKYGAVFDATPSQFLADIDRLCVRYHGNAFLLDEKSPLLALGRDPSSKLVIADRKASRAHGRIERRGNTYYYVDSSTNGSYVTVGSDGEVFLRRREIELKGNGRISFGASAQDPKADFAEFEHL